MKKTSKRPDYTSVSLPKNFVDNIKEHIQNRKDLAYDSVAEYVRYAVRNQILSDNGQRIEEERWEELIDMMANKFKDRIKSVSIEYPFSLNAINPKSKDELKKREFIEGLINSNIPPSVLKFFNDLAEEGIEFQVIRNLNKEKKD